MPLHDTLDQGIAPASPLLLQEPLIRIKASKGWVDRDRLLLYLPDDQQTCVASCQFKGSSAYRHGSLRPSSSDSRQEIPFYSTQIPLDGNRDSTPPP
jgi:hypothetical protein